MLDWDRDVMPVLQATYDVWTAAIAIDSHARFGVPGQEINEKLGRDADGPRTAVVLDRLRDGGSSRGRACWGKRTRTTSWSRPRVSSTWLVGLRRLTRRL